MLNLLFDRSVSISGYLIIPFQHSQINLINLYSYALLSELGHKDKFHKFINPAGLYDESISGIIEIAISDLEENFKADRVEDYFCDRYTYRDNLIIIHELNGKYFYDHYRSDSLANIAAPKIFNSKSECLEWIQTGLNVPSSSNPYKY